jgi:hypothetical protein
MRAGMAGLARPQRHTQSCCNHLSAFHPDVLKVRWDVYARAGLWELLSTR